MWRPTPPRHRWRRLPHLLDVQIRRYEVSYISRMTTAAGNAASTEATSPNSGFACPFTAPYIFNAIQPRMPPVTTTLAPPQPKWRAWGKNSRICWNARDMCLFFSLSLLFNSDTSEALVVSCKPMKHKLFREGQLPVNEAKKQRPRSRAFDENWSVWQMSPNINTWCTAKIHPGKLTWNLKMNPGRGDSY